MTTKVITIHIYTYSFSVILFSVCCKLFPYTQRSKGAILKYCMVIIRVTISGNHSAPAKLQCFPFTCSRIHSVDIPRCVFCAKHCVGLRGHSEEQTGASPALRALSLSSRRPIVKTETNK